jgi:uncharacterized protein YegL
MPVLNDPSLDQQQLPTGQYGYSATRVDDLGAAEYTLVTIVCDVSPSVSSFVKEMEKALRAIVQACKYSPRADNLLVRLVTFHGRMDEVHGFKMLERCNLDDYKKTLKIGSATALYDAAENAISAVGAYGKQLTDSGMDVNGIVFVITDGWDCASTLGVRHVREALTGAVQKESLRSLISILVGVNVSDPQIGAYLQDFRNEAGFTQYVEIDKADAQSLAALADFVSRSISLQSQALLRGGTAPSLGF